MLNIRTEKPFKRQKPFGKTKFCTQKNVVLRLRLTRRKGGHHVPEEDIRRRYYRSKDNFWNQYRQLADNWLLIYNADEGFQEVALGMGTEFVTENEKLFERFIKDINHGSQEV